MASTPILSIIVPDRCCLCNKAIKHDKDAVKPSERELETLKSLVDRWAKVDGSVCSEPPYSDFKFPAQRMLPDTDKL